MAIFYTQFVCLFTGLDSLQYPENLLEQLQLDYSITMYALAQQQKVSLPPNYAQLKLTTFHLLHV